MPVARLIFSWLFGLGIVLNGDAFNSASEVLDIVKVTKDVRVALNKAWNLVDQNINFNEVPIPILHQIENNLFGRFRKINFKLEELNGKAYSTGNNSRSLPEKVRFQLRLNYLLHDMATIDSEYRRMQKYSTAEHDYEKVAMENFAQNVVSHRPNSVLNLMQRLDVFVRPHGKNNTDLGFLGLFANAMKEMEGIMTCGLRQSPQQVLYSLYGAIALSELKGYTMIQFSYMLLRLYGKGNFTTETQRSRESYVNRTNEAVETARKAMQNVSRELWKCDPKTHKRGETYEKITNFLQGYVQNEVDLSSDASCSRECAEFTFSKSNGSNKCETEFCKQQKDCSGRILGCMFIDSNMWICNSSWSERRYDFIQYENGRILGRNSDCSGRTIKAASWLRFIWRCSYCFCLCEEQGFQSDRFFNMRSVISDIHSNKVVTGLRFVKKNRIIHLQIQEGELLPRMIINDTTLSWKEPEDYNIDDRKVFDGQDYHTLTWKSRNIDLDDLEADEGYILTGVRFKEIESHLNFEIYITKFDFGTGKLKPAYSKWKDNPSTEVNGNGNVASLLRKKVALTHPDVPTKSTSPSIPTSQSNQYIEFTHSDMDRDAAQTTVPFLDTQKVESVEAVPLIGAGIFHKSFKYFGGFVAPKIITYDVSKYLKATSSNEEL